MAHVLIVDDDATLCSLLAARIRAAGYPATSVYTLTEAYALAQEKRFDIILLDVVLPDGSGLDFLGRFTALPSLPEVIIMTGAGDPDGAEKAIKCGAWGYLEKPHVLRDLLLPLTRALEYRREKQKTLPATVALNRERIVGSSTPLRVALDNLAAAAGSDANVLLTGESGTGKEIFARTLHDNSRRANQPFMVIDCAALPEALIEGILFGHVRGAYTGATETRTGLIRLADGGSLFLDEIGELALDMQKKFLRVLQEGRYRPIGASQEVISDFRVIAATNRNLEEMVDAGRFRADLLFRLRGFQLQLPPLRERQEDIPALADFFLTSCCHKMGCEPKATTVDFLECLQAYPWPGNVRELAQAIEAACTRARHHQTLFSSHLPEAIRIQYSKNQLLANTDRQLPEIAKTETTATATPAAVAPPPWKAFKSTMEQEYIENLMTYAADDIQQAVRISGLSRARLYQLFKATNYRRKVKD